MIYLSISISEKSADQPGVWQIEESSQERSEERCEKEEAEKEVKC